MVIALRPFQRRFIASALAPGIDTAALSLPRGNGKILAGGAPSHPLPDPWGPVARTRRRVPAVVSGSVEQARLCFRFVRADLEQTGCVSLA